MKTANKQILDTNKEYTLSEAVALLKKVSTSKFIGTVNLDVVIKKSKKTQNDSLKGSVALPHKFGTEKRVIVFADEKLAEEAKKAGAIDAGLEDLMAKVEAGSLTYDVVLATPDVMPKIAKLGRVLGPKGLMPNPTNGTIGTAVTEMVKGYMGGRMNFKMSDQSVVRAGVARLDMSDEQIAENITAILKAVLNEGKKFGGQPFARITLSPTMGSGVKLNLNHLYTNIN